MVVIADPTQLLTVTLAKCGSATLDLTRLSVVAKDQYSEPFALSTATWVPSGAGLSVQGHVLTVTAAGTTNLLLSSGGVTSNSLPVKATLVNRQLKFSTGGGQVVASQTVADGTFLDTGKVRTKRAGFNFTVWNADAALTTKVGKTAVTADTTVYAGWR